MWRILPALFLLVPYASVSQKTAEEGLYLKELKEAGASFSQFFFPKYHEIYDLEENHFHPIIDSCQAVFDAVLLRHASALRPEFIENQSLEIYYYFEKLRVEYPLQQPIHLSDKPKPIYLLPDKILAHMNQPGMLNNADFTNYIKTYLSYLAALRKGEKEYTDNRDLQNIWETLPQLFTNKHCLNYWQTVIL
jgi:hypothetical protein